MSKLDDFIRELQREDPNFGKVDNSKPREEFAFDLNPLSPPLEEIAEFTREEAIERLVTIDDYGRPVTHVPLKQTGRQVFLDFTPAAPDLSPLPKSAPVGEFVWAIAGTIVHAMCPIPEELEFACPPEQVRRFRIRRLFYSRDHGFWSVIMEEPEPGAGQA